MLILIIVLIFFAFAAVLGAVAYSTYQRRLRRAKAIERGLKMVPILIHLPPPSSDTASSNRDVREVMREKTAQAEVLYNLISGTATEGFKSKFYGQRHMAFEIVAAEGLVHFYAAVPVALVSVVEKAILTAYPGARLEQIEDHNIFNQEGRLAATMGGEMVLRAESAYPIATYEGLERDPMEALLTTAAAIDKKDGMAIQIMLRPASQAWVKRSHALAAAKRQGRGHDMAFSAKDLVAAAIKAPSVQREEEQKGGSGGSAANTLVSGAIESIDEKTQHPAFEILIRVLVSTDSVARSQQLLRDIATVFALFEAPGMNGFKFLPALDVQGLVTAYIFRFFPPELRSDVLNSVELATLFHLPDSQFTPSANVEREMSKQVDGPVQLPAVGLLFGYNEFRGVRKEIRLSPEDRRRHTYILGQTGTGKSTMLENLAVQDMAAGQGFAFIDPHGDSAEKLLSMVPKERAEDVIYFNPADTEYPLGLNLFEFTDSAQKDFLIQETIGMLYKLYDPGHTGIIGPRYEHWYRNAALTLMSDPNGSTFIEIPKVFTDTNYLKQKFKYLRDPTVIDFWTKEMAQTSDYHKSEMLGWFVSKFGAFQNNEMMRNIIGQTKSAFNLRDVMDNHKILIVNLSKGRIGELNSQLLGMIFVIKFQAAAMSRAEVPEDQRPDFALYVDEFQNFSTDSFASILSEARKYRLNLMVANQFVGQLKPEVRDAIFGNIGTIVAHRMGPEDAELMVKQFAPVFDASDLINLPNYNAVMRLMVGGLPSQPFTIKDSAPLGGANPALGLAVKQLSAAKFGRSKPVVEAEILDRLAGRAPVAASPAPAATNPSGFNAGPVAAPSPLAQTPAPALVSTGTPLPQPTLQGEVQAPSPMPTGGPAPSVAANTPPVAAAAPIPTPSPVVPNRPDTLSFSDITGVKASNMAISPGQPESLAPADPHANIDVLGRVVPQPATAPTVPVAPAPAPEPTPPAPPAEPMPSEQPEPQAAPAPAEPLIHFVDPTAAAVLNQPEPEADSQAEASSTEPVPTGITFVNPPVSQPVAAAEEPQANDQVPDLNLSLVEALETGSAASAGGQFKTPPAAPAVEPTAPTPKSTPVSAAVPSAPEPVAPPQVVAQPEVTPAPAAELAPQPAPLPSMSTQQPVEEPAPSVPTPPPVAEATVKSPSPQQPVVAQPPETQPAPQAPAPQAPAPPHVVEHKPAPAPAAPVAQAIVSAQEQKKPSPALLEKPLLPTQAAEQESVVVSAPAAVKPTPAVEPHPAPPAAQNELATATTEEPPKKHSVATQVERAEHEIDTLLSTSLIRHEGSGRRRLPEPVAPPVTSEDQEMAPPQQPATHPAIERHGMKILEPLKPIVSVKDEISRELRQLEGGKQEQPEASNKAPVAPAPTPAPEPKLKPPVPPVKPPVSQLKKVQPEPTPVAAPKPAAKPTPLAPQPNKASKPPVPAPSVVQKRVEESELKPQKPTPPEPSIIKHPGQRMGLPPASGSDQQSEFDAEEKALDIDTGGLPPAESLAADEVARSRGEREAAATKSALASESSKRKRKRGKGGTRLEQPAPTSTTSPAHTVIAPPLEAPKPTPAVITKPPAVVSSLPAQKSVEAQMAEEDASGTLTGKLIMPSNRGPMPAPTAPKLERPKKLAPGEVFVDEKGNVSIGE